MLELKGKEILEAARLRACQMMPYLAHAIQTVAIVPHPTPAVGTMGVDRHWRLYWNLEWVEKVYSEYGLEAVAAVFIHEVVHLLMRHADRRSERHPAGWNVAADMEINDDITGLPPGAVMPDTFGFPAHLLAEEYYDLLPASEGEGGDEGQSEGESGDEGQGEGKGGGKGKRQKQDGGEEQGDGQGDKEQGDGGGSSGDSGSGSGGRKGLEGSGVTGVREDWELDSDDETAPAVPASVQEVARQATAQAIADHVRQRGTVPVGLRRWADGLLKPKVNWKRQLRASLQETLSVRGKQDYSYTKPSRRHPPVTGGPIFPSTVDKKGTVAVVVDTSASMSGRDLGQAIAEIKNLMTQVGARVVLISADAAVHAVKEIRDWKEAEKLLLGGGGTDMGVAIKHAAEKVKPRPSAIVVLTDGETPWGERPANIPVVGVIINNPSAPTPPEWVRRIDIRTER
jgi:predicted metal-dependent peptidase